jgi:hypothetical protein
MEGNERSLEVQIKNMLSHRSLEMRANYIANFMMNSPLVTWDISVESAIWVPAVWRRDFSPQTICSHTVWIYNLFPAWGVSFHHCSARCLFDKIINWFPKPSWLDIAVVGQVLLKSDRWNIYPRLCNSLWKLMVTGISSKDPLINEREHGTCPKFVNDWLK